MNWFQKIRAYFGVQYVILVHHDGAHTVKKATFMHDSWWAAPYLPNTRCKLLHNGKIRGQCYIDGWEPITKKVSEYHTRKVNTCKQELEF